MNVFLSYSLEHQALAEEVISQLRGHGHTIVSQTALSLAGAVSDTLSVRRADVCVVMLGDVNASVHFELGFAAGAGVPLIVAAEPTAELPRAMQAVPLVPLTGSSIVDARETVSRIEGLSRPTSRRFVQGRTALDTLRSAVENPVEMESLEAARFESLVLELLKQQGLAVTVRESSRDGGVDLIIDSSDGSRGVLVTLKKLNTQSLVSVEAVRHFRDLLTRHDVNRGLIISTAPFTAAAAALASQSGIELRTIGELVAATSD